MEQDTVSRETVISVFEIVSDSLNISFSANGSEITIIKGIVSDVFDLPEKIPRKMLHFFQRKYGVKIELFFHPGMAHKTTSSIQ